MPQHLACLTQSWSVSCPILCLSAPPTVTSKIFPSPYHKQIKHTYILLEWQSNHIRKACLFFAYSIRTGCLPDYWPARRLAAYQQNLETVPHLVQWKGFVSIPETILEWRFLQQLLYLREAWKCCLTFSCNSGADKGKMYQITFKLLQADYYYFPLTASLYQSNRHFSRNQVKQGIMLWHLHVNSKRFVHIYCFHFKAIFYACHNWHFLLQENKKSIWHQRFVLYFGLSFFF